MAIAFTLKTHGTSGTAGQSYNTASWTPSANTLYLIVMSAYGATPNTHSASGNGLTWHSYANVDFESVASPIHRLSILYSMGASPSAGATTLSIGGSGNLDCLWQVIEVTGTDTTGVDGAGALVQSNTAKSDSAASSSPTLSALGDAANNAVFQAASVGTTGGSWTAGTGYTLVGVSGGESEGTQGENINSQYKVPGTTTPSISWNGTVTLASIAIEIKAASSGTTTTLAPTVGAVSYSGNASSLSFALAPSVGAVTYAGNTPALAKMLSPSSGSVTYDGYAPNVMNSFVLVPSTGSMTFSGEAPALTFDLLPTEGMLIYGGNAPSLGGLATSHYVRRHGRCYFQS